MKLISIFVFLVVISCNKEEFKQPEITNIFSDSSPVIEESKPVIKEIKTSEASQNVGSNVIMKGYVASVTEREKVAYLNFDKKYPNNTFTCVIFSKNFYKFDELKNYDKKNVEVSGKITVYNGKPQIILEDSDQIKILKN